MNEKDLDNWLSTTLPKHKVLTSTVITIIENLLESNNIDYLTISGRTKDIKSIKEKIKRKSYDNLNEQLTDISGIRIILFFESDVKKVSEIIKTSFSLDEKNSLDKDSVLKVNQIGYRSVHFVCDLGKDRTTLPEYKLLEKLKFEFQVRTVLQHAWAELAHDSSYKFSEKLPLEMERKLYLYAGMLELADKGFDDLSREIVDYTNQVESKVHGGDYNIPINSISLKEFIEDWAEKSNFPLNKEHDSSKIGELVSELNQLNITTLEKLKDIIPKDYVEKIKKIKYTTNIFGLIRDWMIINDYKLYHSSVQFGWIGMDKGAKEIFQLYFNNKELAEIDDLFGGFDY